MSSSTVPSLVSLIFIFILMSSLNVTSLPSDSLVQKACSDDSGAQLCIQVLETHPVIVSATNFLNLSIAIIQSGLSNATATSNYIESLTNKSSNASSLQECKKSFDYVIESLKSALGEVTESKDEYQIATYDLLIASTDAIQDCQNHIASGTINDSVISDGIRAAPLYGLSAVRAIDSIQ